MEEPKVLNYIILKLDMNINCMERERLMIMKYIIVAVSILISSILKAQLYQADIEGDLKVKGTLDVSMGKDPTSTFIGLHAGIRSNSFSYNYNTTLGYSSGNRSGNGSLFGRYNTLIGYKSGVEMNTGYYNTFLGTNSGMMNESGSRNTFIGYGAGEDIQTSGSVLIGNQAGKGIKDQDNILYINDRSGGPPLIFGDFANNKLSINYEGNFQDALFIEAPSNKYPFRVRIDGATKIRVHTNGGISLGANEAPPSEGLRVYGLVDTISGRIFCDRNGNIKRSTDLDWITIPPCQFRSSDYNGLDFYMESEFVQFKSETSESIMAPIDLDDDVTIKKVRLIFEDNVSQGDIFISIWDPIIFDRDTILDINDYPKSSNFIQTVDVPVNIPLQQEDNTVHIHIRRDAGPPNQFQVPVGFKLRGILIGYEYP